MWSYKEIVIFRNSPKNENKQNFRFPNGRCVSTTSGRNGTCYSAEECGDRGGDASGECAGGYGVCCVCKL